MKKEKILVTGAAGFIGMHVCKALLNKKYEVVGLDNLNDYYDIDLKKSRLKELKKSNFFDFYKIDLKDSKKLEKLFKTNNFNKIIHLAAQAGVRYSLINPYSYVESNINGFLNLLEIVKNSEIEHLVYASSSSVYGSNSLKPFSEDHNADHSLSLYAATKKANELMAHSYSHLFNIPMTGLRFFTVYGPWGRPDMALFIFCNAISNNSPINIYNHGNMQRGFTYIDDVVQGVIKVLEKPATPDINFKGDNSSLATSHAPYRIFNIGNSKSENLMDYVFCLEKALDKKAKKNFMDIQPGDVISTHADTTKLEEWVGFKPSTDIDTGIKEFVKWYKSYYEKN
tara:strand:- start:3362 stop:4381 length:1020 start_codon:yes stop_codon:yes gene_type:complete